MIGINSIEYQKVVNEIIKGITYMIKDWFNSNATRVYEGIVVSNNNDGRWNIKYNGEIHPTKQYGTGIPTINSIVKVIVPQGNQMLSWFFLTSGESSGGSGDGVTFIPAVSSEGVISWTNNGELPNPSPVNIRGPQGVQGEKGETGDTGPKGDVGPYYTPNVSQSGDLSWSNNGNLTNPPTVNIKGPQGMQGEQGPQGPQGQQGETGEQGIQGETGPYFYPTVSNEGVISWTNNGGLSNPASVNIRGPQGAQGVQGEQGERGIQGEKGDTGPYFTPSVSSSGVLSWTNNGGLANPTSVNIRGPQGEQGEKGNAGEQGAKGDTGPYFTPSVDANGDLSWTNNGGLDNPTTINIKGPQGDKGDQGTPGSNGKDATVNGLNAVTINVTGGLSLSQNGAALTIDASDLQGSFNKVYEGTLNSNNWTDNNGSYYNQISIEDMTSNQGVLVIPQWNNVANEQEAWNQLLNVETFNGYVRFYANTALSVSIDFLLYYTS